MGWSLGTHGHDDTCPIVVNYVVAMSSHDSGCEGPCCHGPWVVVGIQATDHYIR